ncbi:MAG: hypothetical protein AAFV53_17525 [Myxococcota bacterium]
MSVLLLALPLAFAEDASYRGLCAADETVVFSCPVKANKHLSVCKPAATEGLQYRFGPAGSPELTTPAAITDLSVWAYEEKMYARSMAEELTVKNGEYAYTVTSQQSGGPDSFVGVVVRKGEQEIATLPCVGETVLVHFDRLPNAVRFQD